MPILQEVMPPGPPVPYTNNQWEKFGEEVYKWKGLYWTTSKHFVYCVHIELRDLGVGKKQLNNGANLLIGIPYS